MDINAKQSEREKASFRFTPGMKRRIAYLREQWGFESNTATIEISICYLEQLTKNGVQRIDLK